MLRTLPLCTLCLIVLTGPAFADEEPDPSLLTLDRIYAKREFTAGRRTPTSGKRLSARWLEEGDAYLTVEPVDGRRQAIVQHDAATGKKQTLVSSADLSPSFNSTPIKIDDYAISKDRARVLIYTNSKRVWRRNTRGDYWVLDRSSHELTQLAATRHRQA